MKFEQSLLKGKLIKRYKRFFVDVSVNKKTITSHCPNSGSMMGLLDQGNDVWVSKSDNPKRKLKYTLELIKVKNSLVGVNTHRANKIVHEALTNNKIKELSNYKEIKAETVFDKGTRFDFFLQKNKKKIFLEVKSVTLSLHDNIAEFPDSVTERGTKHLLKLCEAKEKGFESYILFLVQRENIKKFKIAGQIDPKYFSSFLKAREKGVNLLIYDCSLDLQEIKVNKEIKII